MSLFNYALKHLNISCINVKQLDLIVRDRDTVAVQARLLLLSHQLDMLNTESMHVEVIDFDTHVHIVEVTGHMHVDPSLLKGIAGLCCSYEFITTVLRDSDKVVEKRDQFNGALNEVFRESLIQYGLEHTDIYIMKWDDGLRITSVDMQEHHLRLRHCATMLLEDIEFMFIWDSGEVINCKTGDQSHVSSMIPYIIDKRDKPSLDDIVEHECRRERLLDEVTRSVNDYDKQVLSQHTRTPETGSYLRIDTEIEKIADNMRRPLSEYEKSFLDTTIKRKQKEIMSSIKWKHEDMMKQDGVKHYESHVLPRYTTGPERRCSLVVMDESSVDKTSALDVLFARTINYLGVSMYETSICTEYTIKTDSNPFRGMIGVNQVMGLNHVMPIDLLTLARHVVLNANKIVLKHEKNISLIINDTEVLNRRIETARLLDRLIDDMNIRYVMQASRMKIDISFFNELIGHMPQIADFNEFIIKIKPVKYMGHMYKIYMFSFKTYKGYELKSCVTLTHTT